MKRGALEGAPFSQTAFYRVLAIIFSPESG